jgi:leader peptidase (prepilin peptidase)/N-methyltransferase
MPDTLFYIYAFLFGAVIGSFLNVCIYRFPAEKSVVAPPSTCGVCGARIRWYDNIPILSYLLLRGRCRACSAPISMQYPVIELATALIWTAAAIRLGVNLHALHSAIFLTLLLGIAMTDAREMVIPDQFTIIGGVIGLLLALAPGGITIGNALLGAVLAYALLWAVKFGAEALLRKPALGTGDIHMMAMIGAFLGPAGALLTLLLGSVLGLLIGLPVQWVRGRLSPLATYLPLGTFLAMGAAIAQVWGPAIIAWYAESMLGRSVG